MEQELIIVFRTTEKGNKVLFGVFDSPQALGPELCKFLQDKPNDKGFSHHTVTLNKIAEKVIYPL